MGLYKKGILGRFRGKVGTVIGSVWKGVAYMRSLPDRSPDAVPSQAQLNAQQRFALAVDFLGNIRSLINVGYQKFKEGITPFNAALGHLIKFGITGTAPNYAINYSQVVISAGSLDELESYGATGTDPAEVTFSWTPGIGSEEADPTDKVTILGYCPATDKFIRAIDVAEREDLTYVLTTPAAFSGEVMHFWLMVKRADGKLVSNSMYLGPVNVL